MSIEKEQLSLDSLDSVVGGDFGDAFGQYGLTGYVDKYGLGAYINQELFFVNASNGIFKWFEARVLSTGEEDDTEGCGTVRTHHVVITDVGNCKGYKLNEQVALNGNLHSAYRDFDYTKKWQYK